ncbi:hypothetical protein BH20ACI4_BH20ACI4_24890 [soil metagenome]
MASKKLSVRVRMYRQGLGDCFLLTFRRGTKDIYNMMIDCGLFLGTKRGKEIMTQVAENVKDETGGKINAVVLTHEHWDHISGFSLAKDVFDKKDSAGKEEFVFDEVWMGWTENENDPKFTEVRERFKKKKKGLRVALDQVKNKDSEKWQTINSLVNEFFGEDENAAALVGMSGADTWKYVLGKSVTQPPRYCSPGEIHTPDGLDGVRIYVLGPPEDFDRLDDEESPEAETYRRHLRAALTDSFLAAATGDDNSLFDAEAFLPFDEKYRIAEDKAEAHSAFGGFFKTNYGDDKSADAWRQINEDWLEMMGDLALNIDGITNNTCLALAIELVESKKVLIFPGDAQFGNWISWQDLKWEIPDDATGAMREIKVNELLRRTVFYKVGHHGSHNATLKKSGLELMESPELVAMIPTNQKFAKNKKTSRTPDGWKMPEQELLVRLEQKAKGRVILADEYGGAADEKKPFKVRCGNYNMTAAEKRKFLNNVKFGGSFLRLPDDTGEEPLYVEYVVKE